MTGELEQAYLTPAQAAAVLGLSASAVRRLCRIHPREGGLRAFHPGNSGRYLIARAELDAWARRQLIDRYGAER